MKITKITSLVLLILIGGKVDAQSDYQMKANDKTVEIDFLSGYYYQDGDNAAVTGGIGTESLFDASNIIVVNVPIDSTRSVSLYGGIDYYSSASTDNIDNNKSSASSEDVRTYATLGYTKKQLKHGMSYGATVGFSTEYDYNSFSTGIHLSKEMNNGNSEISFSAQAFIDQWELIFPKELRGEISLPTNNRQSFNGQLTFSQVLTKRIQIAISAEAIYMTGLLSTPFHRVYFSELEIPDIERLPSTRLKIPFALRLNYKPSAKFAIRTYYRYYSDDFGINAHTANLEIPIDISDSWSVSPFYRWHSQTASTYFAPYKAHFASEEFYSSDYDLSALSSHKFGLGINYKPLYGLARIKIPMTKRLYIFDKLSLRVSSYNRSTGLYGVSAAVGVGMKF